MAAGRIRNGRIVERRNIIGVERKFVEIEGKEKGEGKEEIFRLATRQWLATTYLIEADERKGKRHCSPLMSARHPCNHCNPDIVRIGRNRDDGTLTPQPRTAAGTLPQRDRVHYEGLT
jgi:hypothetical protein